MTAAVISPYTAASLKSGDRQLKQKFSRRFPRTRESYDGRKEQEVVAIVSGSTDWKRVGKPWFRRDAVTGIVFRRAPASRLYPTGRITVCVPHEVAFHVTALEHLESHALSLEGRRPDSIDSTIAAKYTGVDRDQLRFMRKHCLDCNADAGSTFEIPLDCPQVVRSLLVTPDTLDPKSHPSTKIGGSDPARRRGPMTGGEVDDLSLSSTARYSNVFWIGCEDKITEPVSTQILQHRQAAAVNSAHVPSCFLLDQAAQLLSVVGPAFLSMDCEQVTAHQSIVTASTLADRSRCKVMFQTANWLQRQLMQGQSILDCSAMLMLAWRRYDPEYTTIVEDIYAHVKKYEPGVLRVFPAVEELEHAHGKIDDIRALDQVAWCAPSGWSFRPITCDCTSACRLGEAGVLKRTHSCGSEHVIVHPTASDVSRHLQCLSGQRRTSKRKVAQITGRWFHQEFIEGLRTTGEFRVFIVTARDTTATRGRRGVVIELVHTLELADRELVVTVLTSRSAWPEKSDTYREIDLQELKKFAVHVFDALRNRPDWSTNFESLEIGARVDVGVTTVGDACRYFVNEITRIYEADFFAEWLAQPGTHICEAVARAVEEVFIASSDG